MRYVPLSSAIIFVLFAVTQLNDPDPLPWVILYLSTAGLLALAHWKRYYLWLGIAATVIMLVGLVTFIPEFFHWVEDGMPSIVSSMQAATPYVELVREFFGLLLCSMVASWYTLRSFRTRAIN